MRNDEETFFSNRSTIRAENGQFKKGHSGNPGGRPRSKNQRALSCRQYRRDVLAVTEEMVSVRSGGGTTLVPFHVANLLAIRAKASQGHAPSQRHIDKLHREAIKEHEEVNRKQALMLEQREAQAVSKSVDGLNDWEWRSLNLVRKYSWRV